MSPAALFAFGCVIFFTVATGAFLYVMMTIRVKVDRERIASFTKIDTIEPGKAPTTWMIKSKSTHETR